MEIKTAMQELLEWTRKTLPMDLDTPRMIEAKIESLLKVEKEQIKDARDSYINQISDEINDMLIYGEVRHKELTSEEYYNKTYANDTTEGLPEEDSKRRGWHY
jgi:hypothetical protein